MSALTDNQTLFKKWIKNYACALKIKEVYNDDETKNGFYSFMSDFKEWLYSSIHEFLSKSKTNSQYEITIKTYCKYIKEKILPICNAKIKEYSNITKRVDNHIFLNKWLDLEDDFYALASYRDIKMFALYLERGKSNKLWAKTMHLFENFFLYCQKLVFKEEPINLIRASYFPGAGKTYGANILCAFWFGYDEDISILRITYSDDLCQTFIRQIAEIINSKEYRKVFPKFDKGELTSMGNSELYSKYSIAMGFQFKFSSVMNFYSSTRDGQTTGKRAKVLMIDDLTKGVTEAHDEKLHKRMEDKFDTEWCSRADSEEQPVIALGTMWSNIDLLNVLRTRALKESENNIVEDSKFKYTEIGKNKDKQINSVFISTPILDYETDESTCPLRYSTKSMKKKRDNMDITLWNAVYQQRPTPPDEFLFDYKKLNVYSDETYPMEQFKNNPTECFAFIDPNRKGVDFLAMGIFKRYQNSNNEWSKWYLIDCIFEQTPTKQLYTDIALKICNHKVTKLGYENNIDGSFDEVIYYKLKEMGYQNGFIIEGFFSSNQSKETKIFNASYGMRSEIIYPSIKTFGLGSQMGKGMQQLTNWSLSQKSGDHDDFPDMVAMFVKYFCEEEQQNMIEVLPENFRL